MESQKEVDIEIEPVSCDIPKLVHDVHIEIEPLICEFSNPVQDGDIKVIEPVTCKPTELVLPVNSNEEDIYIVYEEIDEIKENKGVEHNDIEVEPVIHELSKLMLSVNGKEEDIYIVYEERDEIKENKAVDATKEVPIAAMNNIEQDELERSEKKEPEVLTLYYTLENVETKSANCDEDSTKNETVKAQTVNCDEDSTKNETVECTSGKVDKEGTMDFGDHNNTEEEHLACVKDEEHTMNRPDHSSEEEIEKIIKEDILENDIEVEVVSNDGGFDGISKDDENFKEENSKAPQNDKKEIPHFKKYLSDQKTKYAFNGIKRDARLKESKPMQAKGTQSEDAITEDSFQTPSDALVEKIIRNAEFYFTDFNVLKNNFLLKHIRRNKEGYVSLKLVASFRKVKYLTKDFRVVSYSLERSKVLELNANKTKVRRIIPIPKLQDTKLGKTVMVFNLEFQNPSSEKLMELFSKFGNVISAEIMSSKSANFNIYHKRCRFYNKELSSSSFGCVEFENYEDAMSSIKDVESHLPKENKMKVAPLLTQVTLSKPRIPRYPFAQDLKREKEQFRPARGQFEDLNPNQPWGSGRPLKNNKGYNRFYQQSYPPNFAPNAFNSQNHSSGAFYAAKRDEIKKSYFAPNRQLKISNSMNVNKTGVLNHQTKGLDMLSRKSD